MNLAKDAGAFPSPLRGGARGGGPDFVHGRLTKFRPPSPTLLLKGGGSTPSARLA